MAITLLGSTQNLVGGVANLGLKPGSVFWYIQNQDVAPLRVSFLGPRSGIFSPIVLNPGNALGVGGGYLDSIGFGYFDTLGFALASSIANAQFGSGQSNFLPVNDYVYPGSPLNGVAA